MILSQKKRPDRNIDVSKGNFKTYLTCRVSTYSSQKLIMDKAQQINWQDILLRLNGPGHDMVANDICYHPPCMNAFRALRIPKGAHNSSASNKPSTETYHHS